MTTATRLGNVLARLSFGAITSMGLLALPIAGSHPAMAQNHGPAALTGTVSSPEEGKMEGVVVSAKRPGSTIMVSVSTNAQGQYSFPQDRLAPGAYDITIRAVGYTLKPTAATIQSGGSTQLDLSAREGRAGRSRPSNVQQRVDAKRAGHARAENGIAEMSRLSWPAASVLFQGQCVGNGDHGAAHERAYPECLSQFSFLLSERIRDFERSADQGAGGLRGLHRFDQSQLRRNVALSS